MTLPLLRGRRPAAGPRALILGPAVLAVPVVLALTATIGDVVAPATANAADARAQDVGSLEITKRVDTDSDVPEPVAAEGADQPDAVDGQDADPPRFVDPAGYRIGYECTDGTKGEVTLKRDKSARIDNIAAGSTCSVIEDTDSAQVPGYVLDAYDPGENGVLIEKDAVTPADVLNYYFPLRGSFVVTKTVTGEAAGKADGRTFTIAYSCTNATGGVVNGTVELTDGERQQIGAYAGECVITEKDASIEGTALTTTYSVDGGEATSDSATVAVARNGNVQQVAVTNTYSDSEQPPVPEPSPDPQPSEPAPSPTAGGQSPGASAESTSVVAGPSSSAVSDPAQQGGGLARTGAEAAPLVVLATGLLGVGGTTALIRRRRQG